MPYVEEITVHEGESKYIDFKLSYGSKWSASAKRGTNVLEADVTTAYFYIKTTDASGAAWLSLSTANTNQMTWIADGHLRVKLGDPTHSDTEGQVADNQPWECRLKMSDGRFITVHKGKINILESTVDTP